MDKQVNKTKLAKLIKEMQLNQLNHLKKEMTGIETISEYTCYRRRRAKQQKNMNIKNEYDRLIGELTQTNITAGTKDRIARRKRDIKATYQGSQHEKNILLP